MLMNQIIKSRDGVEYSIHKTVRVRVQGLYKFISQTMPQVSEFHRLSGTCMQ